MTVIRWVTRSWLVLLAVLPAVLLGGANAYAEGGTAAVAWGENDHMELGVGFHSNFEERPETVLGLSGVAAMASGWEDSFALLSNGTLRAWGNGYRGQLGDGVTGQMSGPVPVLNLELGELSHVSAIATGGAHSLALLEGGNVVTWGDSMDGTRGNGESGPQSEAEEHGDYVNRKVAAEVPHLEHVKQVAAAGNTDYALLEDGKVLSWGGNGNGKLGIGVETGKGKTETPKPESCRVESSKERREAEEAEGGEAEAGEVACSKVPVEVGFTFSSQQVSEHVTVTGIAGGYVSAYALLSNGEVMAWGNGNDGELGNGTMAGSDVPVPVDMAAVPSCPALSSAAHCPVVEVAPGRDSVWALTAAGEVIGWGLNGGGTLGSEGEQECKKGKPHDCSTRPKTVISPETLKGVTAISVGKSSWGLALSEGTIYALGANERWGQLGLGGGISSTSTPLPIEGLGPVAGIAAGEESSLAFLSSGSGPAPVLTLTPGSKVLKVKWTISRPEIKLRLKVIAEKGRELSGLEEKESKTVALSSTGCSGEKPCEYTFNEVRKGEVLTSEDVYTIRMSVAGEDNRDITGIPLP